MGLIDDGFNRFALEAKEALLIHQGLKLLTMDSIPVLEGILQLSSANLTDSFSIRIVPTNQYPNCFPLVYETGNRIMPNIDWHFHSDGHCCLCTPPEEIIICSKGFNLKSFISEFVVPYFFNQKHREVFGYFLNERSHGVEGIIEFFKGKLNTDDISIVLEALTVIKDRVKFERTDYCFCNSKAKFRNCHKNAIIELSLLNNDQISVYIKLIKEYLLYKSR